MTWVKRCVRCGREFDVSVGRMELSGFLCSHCWGLKIWAYGPNTPASEVWPDRDKEESCT